MALNFPDSPTPGQVYSYGGVSWIWDGTVWLGNHGVAPGIPIAGTANQALTKVDGTDFNTQWAGPMLPTGGGTMTGVLALAADPLATTSAATKNYVDRNSGASLATLYFENTVSDLQLPALVSAALATNGAGNPDTITRADGGSFLTDGFLAGQKITVSGFSTPANNGTFVVVTVVAATMTLATIHSLTTEAAGPVVTIRQNRETWSPMPYTGNEIDESQSLVLADGDVALDTYLTPPRLPGLLLVEAGLWDFHAWAYVDSITATTTTMKFRLVKVSGTTGLETVLFTTFPTTITATTLGAAQEIVVQYAMRAPVVMLATDRLAVRVMVNTSTSTARVAHFLYQGTVRPSHVHTTLALHVADPSDNLYNHAVSF